MKIKIKTCFASGKQFGNLIEGSEHDVIEKAFSEYRGRSGRKGKYLMGYWVMGVGEKVVVLLEECNIVVGSGDVNNI